MKKTLIIIVAIIVALSSITPAFAEKSIYDNIKTEIKLISQDNIITKKEGYIVYNEYNEYSLQWTRNPEVDYYLLQIDGINHFVDNNSFDFNFNDPNNHVIIIFGFDSTDNIIASSKGIVTTRSIKEYDSVLFSNERLKVVSKETSQFQSISWGLVKNADSYKVTYYENNKKVYEDKVALNYAKLDRFQNKDKDADWELIVQAYNGSKLLAESSLKLKYVSNLSDYYDMVFAGLEDNKVFWDGKLNIRIRDNSNDFVIDNTCFIYDVMIKDASGKVVENYLYRSYYGEENLKLIDDELKEGNYKITIDAYLAYNSGYGITDNNTDYNDLSYEEIMDIIRYFNMPRIKTIEKDVRISSKGSVGQVPSDKYIEDIRKIYTEIPERLNSSYDSYLTRFETSELALTFYDRTVVKFERPMWDIYDDTDNEYAEGAAIHLMPRFESSFKGNSFITREEFAATLKRYLAFRWIVYDDYFKLVDASTTKVSDIGMVKSEYKNDVKFMIKYGIMDLKSNGQFDPKGRITREEAFAYLSRLYDINNEKFLYLKYE